jgi:hypothetical protein
MRNLIISAYLAVALSAWAGPQALAAEPIVLAPAPAFDHSPKSTAPRPRFCQAAASGGCRMFFSMSRA